MLLECLYSIKFLLNQNLACYFVTDWVIRLISVLTLRSYGKFTLMTRLYRMLVEIAMIIFMPAKGAL